MKRIAIINNECFRDTDIALIEILQNDYEIDYYVILDKEGVADIEYLKSLTSGFRNFRLYPVNGIYRRRSLKYAVLSYLVLKRIRKRRYYRILTGIKEDIFMSLLFFLFVKRDSTIYMLHDAESHPYKGIDLARLTGACTDKVFICQAKAILLFSKEQLEILRRRHPNCKAVAIDLRCAFYGTPDVDKPSIERQCRFLFFGHVSYYKNIEVLIRASERLNKHFYGRFAVSVIGGESYKEWRNSIETPAIFNLDIRKFDDKEIPNIFESHHFLVLPYRQVTQSGPLSLSFQYRIPTIASDLDIFRRFIKNGQNGFLFHSNDEDELESVMAKCIQLNKDEYNAMRIEVEKIGDKILDKQVIKNQLLDIIS